VTIRNIQVFVNAIALASGELPEKAVYLVDDSPGGSGRGSVHLETHVEPGDLVRWTLIPIDLQAPAFIRSVAFEGMGAPDDGIPSTTAAIADVGEAGADVPTTGRPLPIGRSLRWEGLVPMVAGSSGRFPYTLHVAFTDRHPATIAVAGPSLRVTAPRSEAVATGSLLAADDIL